MRRSRSARGSRRRVRRLQEYARPGRVKGPEAVQLRDVLEHLLALTRPQWDNEAARRGIRYDIDLKIEPAPAILAVASEVREAILNILENALAAMARGGRLTMHVRGVGKLAILSITDTGKGMSEDVQKLAFARAPKLVPLLGRPGRDIEKRVVSRTLVPSGGHEASALGLCKRFRPDPGRPQLFAPQQLLQDVRTIRLARRKSVCIMVLT